MSINDEAKAISADPKNYSKAEILDVLRALIEPDMAYDDSRAGIAASVHLMYAAESARFLAENELIVGYDEGDDAGTPVLTDKAIELLASWLAGEGWVRK